MRDSTLVRYTAIGAAFAAALLYLLIGLKVLWIGEATNGQTTDIGAFGAVMFATYAAVGLVLLRWHSRAVLAGVAAIQVVTLVGYVALAGVRTPQFETWGVLIKVCQLVILVAVTYLALREERAVA